MPSAKAEEAANVVLLRYDRTTLDRIALTALTLCERVIPALNQPAPP